MAERLTKDDDLGEFAEDFTSLNWRYEEHWSGEIARFNAAGYTAFVRDCDGDSTYWWVKRHGETIAEGDDAGHTPHHFFACLKAAEEALRTDAAARRNALKGDA